MSDTRSYFFPLCDPLMKSVKIECFQLQKSDRHGQSEKKVTNMSIAFLKKKHTHTHSDYIVMTRLQNHSTDDF